MTILARWHACLKTSADWIREFSADYWKFFAAAFFMDLGFGLFFFLFPLYLTDLHFDERFIGHAIACLTLGNVAGTIPAMFIARRIGLRPLLVITFAAVPALCVLRVLIVWPPAQLVLAFCTGVALCGWPICFSPTIAALTDAGNRARGFSIAFATGIGLGTVSGIAGGYVPEILNRGTMHLPIIDGIRVVLLLACAITALGLLPLQTLPLRQLRTSNDRRIPLFHPFLKRFLPGFLLWNIVTSSFPVFGAVFLQKSLGIPLGNLGSIFSASQLTQFTAVALSPLVFKKLGMAKGIAAAQMGTAMMLVFMSRTQLLPLVVCFYLLYFGTQFMCGPGIYTLLMERIPEEERSSASAIQNLTGALCQAGTAALTGVGIVNLGYHKILVANAGVALLAAGHFFLLGRKMNVPAVQTVDGGSATASAGHAREVFSEPYARRVIE
jgi:MFS family permease